LPNILEEADETNQLPNHPGLTDCGSMALSLKRQLDAYKAHDPNETRHKAVPLTNKVFQLFLNSKDDMSSACTELIIRAFFFAMQSCEYSKTTSPNETRTTKLLTLQNVRFFKISFLIFHGNPDLASAYVISITFETQKNKTKVQTINMHESLSNLSPVVTWAAIVKCI
jgi:hypothetical protein